MKTFDDIEELKHLEELDREIKRRTNGFDTTSIISIVFFICSMIFGLSTYGWITLILGIFTVAYALNLCMNIHSVIQQKNTFIQIKDSSEKLRNFMIENLKND